MDKIKIIIDTDIGDDADDALAICLALKSEELEYRKDMDGVEYLRRSLSASQGDITLVTIGPLTNVGVLLCKYPEVKGKIKEIVMMGGAYYMHYNEWNILCDPEAAHIVYSSGVPIRAIGLDVTTRCQVNDQLVTMFRNSKKPEVELLADLLTCYYENRGRHTFLHDPMAVFAVYDKDIITYQGEDIHVELHGQHTRGTTFNTWKIGGGNSRQNVQCAKDIKAEEFVRRFKEIIMR